MHSFISCQCTHQTAAGHVHECDRPGSAPRGGTHDFPLQNHDRDTRYLARTNIASGVKEDDLKPIKDLLKMADRSPTDVAQTYMRTTRP